jgi:hydroxymethylbilane synthase
MRPLIAGTRGSALALWQTEHAVATLRSAALSRGVTLEFTVKKITTRGDTDQSPVLAGKLGKGFFTLELEAALRARDIDFAVHSLKDLPTIPAADLAIGAILERGPPQDLLIARPEAVKETNDGQLPLMQGAKVGSSSLRRQALLARYAPGVSAEPLRGNVPTRLTKLGKGQYQAIVLAAAGVERLELDLTPFAVFDLNPRVWIPAPGQGAVAIQCRDQDHELEALLSVVTHRATADDTALERLYLQRLEGGCTTPFGCFAAGTDLCLGLDAHGGWKRAIARRAAAGDAAGHAKIASLLDTMQTAGFRESAYKDWLYRPHRKSEG